VTIDERPEKLTERHQALTETVELLAAENRHIAAENRQMAAENRQRDRRMAEIMEGIARLSVAVAEDGEHIRALARIAEIHHQRLERLEGSWQALRPVAISAAMKAASLWAALRVISHDNIEQRLLIRSIELGVFRLGLFTRQRASERDIIQMLPVSSLSTMAIRPPAADHPRC
jgi:predicted RNase H-like nuclease (RuvC/YqgF family)